MKTSRATLSGRGCYLIDLVIEVFRNKQVLGGVYLDKGTVLDSLDSAETVDYKTLVLMN